MKNYPSAADITEMKARGYDPSTLESLEEDRKRGERAEVLCRQIEEAFSGVTLGIGVGLTEGQGLTTTKMRKHVRCIARRMRKMFGDGFRWKT